MVCLIRNKMIILKSGIQYFGTMDKYRAWYSTKYVNVWNAMTCISQLMEGGGFLILYMVKKLQDLSVSSSNICQGLLPQGEKKER